MKLTITVPTVQVRSGLASLIGVLGLLGLPVAIAGLTGVVWWAVLAGSAECLYLAVAAQLRAEKDAEVQAPQRERYPADPDATATLPRIQVVR